MDFGLDHIDLLFLSVSVDSSFRGRSRCVDSLLRGSQGSEVGVIAADIVVAELNHARSIASEKSKFRRWYRMDLWCFSGTGPSLIVNELTSSTLVTSFFTA